MPYQILAATPHPAFGELLRLSLEEGGNYRVRLVQSALELLSAAARNGFVLAILDSDLRDMPFAELVRQLSERCPHAKIIVIPPENNPQHPMMEGVVAHGTINKPFYLPDLLETVQGLLGDLPAEPAAPKPAATAVESRPTEPIRPRVKTGPLPPAGPELPPPAWANDVNLAAQHLTSLMLESSAHAAMIARGDTIFAYAGHLSKPAAEEMVGLLARYWKGGRTDLARFVRLHTEGGDYLLYATTLWRDLVLAMVYDVSMPLTRIRAQAGRLVRGLSTRSEPPTAPVVKEPVPVEVEPQPVQPKESPAPPRSLPPMEGLELPISPIVAESANPPGGTGRLVMPGASAANRLGSLLSKTQPALRPAVVLPPPINIEIPSMPVQSDWVTNQTQDFDPIPISPEIMEPEQMLPVQEIPEPAAQVELPEPEPLMDLYEPEALVLEQPEAFAAPLELPVVESVVDLPAGPVAAPEPESLSENFLEPLSVAETSDEPTQPVEIPAAEEFPAQQDVEIHLDSSSLEVEPLTPEEEKTSPLGTTRLKMTIPSQPVGSASTPVIHLTVHLPPIPGITPPLTPAPAPTQPAATGKYIEPPTMYRVRPPAPPAVEVPAEPVMEEPAPVEPEPAPAAPVPAPAAFQDMLDKILVDEATLVAMVSGKVEPPAAQTTEAAPLEPSDIAPEAVEPEAVETQAAEPVMPELVSPVQEEPAAALPAEEPLPAAQELPAEAGLVEEQPLSALEESTLPVEELAEIPASVEDPAFFPVEELPGAETLPAAIEIPDEEPIPGVMVGSLDVPTQPITHSPVSALDFPAHMARKTAPLPAIQPPEQPPASASVPVAQRPLDFPSHLSAKTGPLPPPPAAAEPPVPVAALEEASETPASIDETAPPVEPGLQPAADAPVDDLYMGMDEGESFVPDLDILSLLSEFPSPDPELSREEVANIRQSWTPEQEASRQVIDWALPPEEFPEEDLEPVMLPPAAEVFNAPQRRTEPDSTPRAEAKEPPWPQAIPAEPYVTPAGAVPSYPVVNLQGSGTIPEPPVPPSAAPTVRVQPSKQSLEDTQPRRSLPLTSLNQLDSTSAGLSFITYTCVLMPRLASHSLTGELAEKLSAWIPQLCLAFGWRLEGLVIRSDLLQWTVRVSPTVSPGNLVRILRERTSERIFNYFLHYKAQNPSGDFWAGGYLVVNGTQPPTPQLINDFIAQTRRRQGIS